MLADNVNDVMAVFLEIRMVFNIAKQFTSPAHVRKKFQLWTENAIFPVLREVCLFHCSLVSMETVSNF